MSYVARLTYFRIPSPAVATHASRAPIAGRVRDLLVRFARLKKNETAACFSLGSPNYGGGRKIMVPCHVPAYAMVLHIPES